MDKYKKLATNTITLTLGQLGSKLLVVVMMRFYTLNLGSEGFGAVGNIVDASTLLIAVVTLSIGESIIRFGLEKGSDKSQVFSIGIKTTLAGLLVLIPFVPLIGKISFLSPYAILIYIYVFTGSLKSTCSLFVRSIGFVRLYAIDGIFTTFVNIVLNILFLSVLNMDVMGYVLSVVLADVASIILVSVISNLKQYFRLFGTDRKLRNAMYRYCIPMIPTSIMWWITSVSDSFFVTAMLGQHENGIYKAAYKLPNVIMLISGVFSQAWNMSAITEKNSRTIAKFYTNVFNFFQSIIYVMSAGILLIIRPALDFMAVGEGYDVTETFRHTPLLVLAVIFTCFSTFMGSIYVASKKSVRTMTTVSIGAGLNLLLNALLIPSLGIDGAALATLISYVAVFIARVVDTRGLVFMNLMPAKMITNIISIIIMSLIIMFVKNDFAYYISLVIVFLFVVVINYRAGIAAINVVIENIKKRRAG